MNRFQKFLQGVSTKLLSPTVAGDKPVFQSFFSFLSPSRKFTRFEYYYGTAYSCIDAIATSVCSAEFGLYIGDKDENSPVDNHEAITLLHCPNGFQTGVDLIYTISSHIDAHGVAYLYPVKSLNGQHIVQLWALDPSKIITVLGDNFIDGYVYVNPKGVRIPFAPAELIPIMRPNPFALHMGVSTIEMARYAIEGDLRAQEWNATFFENGATPSGVLTSDVAINDITFQQIKKRWHENWEGKENAHKTAILGAGLKYQQLSLRQKDMDFLEQRKFNRNEILSIFKVPKPILAISDDVNRASAETAEYVFANRVIKPRLSLIFEKLNEFYLPLFKGTEGMMLDFENPVPENEAQQLEEAKAGANIWLKVNELRQRDGFDPIDGGDTLYVPNTYVPITLASQMTELPSPPVAQQPVPPAKAMTKAVSQQRKREVQYMAKRNRYLAQQETAYQKDLQPAFDELIRFIKEGKKSGETKAPADVEAVFHQVIPNLTHWQANIAKLTFTHGYQVMTEAVQQTSESFDFAVPPIENLNARVYMEKRAQDSAETITNTILSRAREIIANQFKEGISDLDTVKSAIASDLKDTSEYKISRIARTELIDAYSQAATEDYKASGIVEQVKWLVAPDCDDECLDNADEVISLGDAFPSGDDDPPVHPNCRCCVVPFFN
jgi:HK97 family phage portal protein